MDYMIQVVFQLQNKLIYLNQVREKVLKAKPLKNKQTNKHNFFFLLNYYYWSVNRANK